VLPLDYLLHRVTESVEEVLRWEEECEAIASVSSSGEAVADSCLLQPSPTVLLSQAFSRGQGEPSSREPEREPEALLPRANVGEAVRLKVWPEWKEFKEWRAMRE